MRAHIPAVILAAALSMSGVVAHAAQAGPPGSEVTSVDGVTVTAPNEVRLMVAVAGDMGRDLVVTSSPIGLNCGGAMFQYMSEENRQCWLWVRRNRSVILTAQGLGRYGVDWTVEWIGCEPLANGAACEVKPRAEMDVAAVFTRKGG